MDLANLENYVWIYVRKDDWDQNLIPCGLWHLSTLFGEGPIDFNGKVKWELFQKRVIGFWQWNIGVVPGNVRVVPGRNYIE